MRKYIIKSSKQVVAHIEIRYDKKLASQFIKRLVFARDSDFTKLTPEERKRLEAAEQRIDSKEYVKTVQKLVNKRRVRAERGKK